MVVFVWVSVFDTNRFTVTGYEFRDSKVEKPLRAVFLSDLHCKMYGYGGTFLLEKIRETNPDIILIGGDMITAYPGKKYDQVEAFIKELARDYPLIYAFGNHELRLKIYPDKYGNAWERYSGSLAGSGIRITENDTVSVEGTGVNIICFSADKRFYKRLETPEMDPGYIRETVGRPDESKFNILLAHNPGYFAAYKAYGADLTLSGHLHGGVVRLPVPVSKKARENGAHVMRGVLSPGFKFFPKYDGGRFDEDGHTMIISRGLGTHTLPLRIFNPGELIVIDLKP